MALVNRNKPTVFDLKNRLERAILKDAYLNSLNSKVPYLKGLNSKRPISKRPISKKLNSKVSYFVERASSKGSNSKKD